MKSEKTRVIFFDLETAPMQGYVWGLYETNVVRKKQNGYLLCFAVRQQGKAKIDVYALPDFPLWKKDKTNDRDLVKKLHEVMSQADVIVAHNADAFDLKVANTRFLMHGLQPLPPHKSYDTLKAYRKVAKFPSNKLDDLCQDLGIGRKVKHPGIDLWLDCMEGNPKAWRLMTKYNKQDVALLEAAYTKIRSWTPTHPDLHHDGRKCPVCGSTRIFKCGVRYSGKIKKQQWHCPDCGKWPMGEIIKG